MSKKDYEMLASCVREALKDSWNESDTKRAYGVRDLASRITLELELDNPRFNRAKFEKACGLA